MSKKRGNKIAKKKRTESGTIENNPKVKTGPEPTKRWVWPILTVVIAVTAVASAQGRKTPSHDDILSSEPAHDEDDHRAKAGGVVPINSDASSINGNNKGNNNSSIKRSKLSEVFDVACTRTGMARCMLEYLDFDDESRTIVARRRIPENQALIEVAPQLQITSLDAVRDPRLESLLDAAPREALTGSAPTGRTWLAVYLVLEVNRLRTKPGDPESWSPRDRVFRTYFNYLPTLEDFLSFHPTAKKIFEIKDDLLDDGGDRDLEPDFPLFSPFLDQNTINIARKVIYEYEAFSAASEGFSDDVSFEDFAWAQLIVTTRGLARNTDLDDIDDEEMERLASRLHRGEKDQLGVVMMPLIDALNDRIEVNVRWKVNFPGVVDPTAVTLYSAGGIEAGEELLVSYGTSHADYQRLAQYGFANTNGLETSLATLAPYHRPAVVVAEEGGEGYDAERRKQKEEAILRYLSFGDGCPPAVVVVGAAESEMNLFQRARFRALESVFHRTSYWYAVTPPKTKTNLIKKKKHRITDQVMTTCRIVAMTHRDYDGMSVPLLENFAANPTYLRPSKDEALEYRAYHVLERLASETASRIREVLAEEMMLVVDGDGGSSFSFVDVEVEVEAEARRRLESNELDPTSPVGMRAYVLHNEIDSLVSVVDLARKKKKFYLAKKRKKIENGEAVNEEGYVIRAGEACPSPPPPPPKVS